MRHFLSPKANLIIGQELNLIHIFKGLSTGRESREQIVPIETVHMPRMKCFVQRRYRPNRPLVDGLGLLHFEKPEGGLQHRLGIEVLGGPFFDPFFPERLGQALEPAHFLVRKGVDLDAFSQGP